MSKIYRNVIFSKSINPTPIITHCTISNYFWLFLTISIIIANFSIFLTISYDFDQFPNYSLLFLVISVLFPIIPLLFFIIYLLNPGILIKISLRNLVCKYRKPSNILPVYHGGLAVVTVGRFGPILTSTWLLQPSSSLCAQRACTMWTAPCTVHWRAAPRNAVLWFSVWSYIRPHC